MHTVGIIAEYNPFHTGHAYHLKQAKEISGADYAVIVMSPDFVQRGEPAVFDKYTRAGIALQNGADLVLELPVCYATGSAEYFAEGTVVLLDRLGVINTLCFGGESDDGQLFGRFAGLFLDEPIEYTRELVRLQKKGLTYPQARSIAAVTALKSELPVHGDILRDFLSAPNNILGIEYCKALQKTESAILPMLLKRKGSRYSSHDLDGPYCSATALRKGIFGGAKEKTLLRYVPENCHTLFQDACKNAVIPEVLTPYLAQKLLSTEHFDRILDISSDLSDRIKRLRYSCIGKPWAETVTNLKTKQVTEARIRRALLHLILGLEKDTTEQFRKNGTIFYAKVLGFRREAAPLLHQIKEKSRIPFITKNTEALDVLEEIGLQMWKQDLFASHLYRSIQAGKFHMKFRTEYEITPVIF